MPVATLTLSSKNYSSWSLRGWLMARFAGLDFKEEMVEQDDAGARAHCRSICGEMHSGFSALRSALPMNLKASFPNFTVWSRAQGDIERVAEIWRDGLTRYGGPYLFGKKRSIADAMYAPVVTRFLTYGVPLDDACAAYCQTLITLPEMQEWIAAARLEPDDIEELEMEF